MRNDEERLQLIISELRASRDALEKAYNDLKEDIDWILEPYPCCPNKTEYGMKVWNRISELQYNQPHWLNWKKENEPWTRADDLEMM